MLSPVAVGLGAFACLIFALAVAVLGYGKRQAGNEALNAHLQRTLGRQAVGEGVHAPVTGAAGKSSPSPWDPAHVWVQRWLYAIGAQTWGVSRRAIWGITAVVVLLFVSGWTKFNAAFAVVAVLVFGLGVCFFFWKRLEKKRQKMLEQLPGFLDNMVRLITIGSSPQAAFQMSVKGVPEPLGSALQQASGVLSASSNLGYAMEQLEGTWRLPEFGLLAAVFRMSTKYGGRTDLVLERVAAYIRDKHSAERELYAMSAEVRLSAWLLSLLPIVVGAFIMLVNDGYFLRMWQDDSGRKMILLAAGLELAGVILLYRLAKLK